MTAKRKILSLLKQAGIEANGKRSFDVQIYDDRVFERVLSGGARVAGETFVEKWWDVDDLSECIYRLRQTNVYRKLLPFDAWGLLLKDIFLNLQSKRRAYAVALAHYDLGNKLYIHMLGARLVYACAMWSKVSTLEEAEEQLLETVCQKLQLKAGDHIVDVGCGWGSFMKYAAERYGVSCVGLTVSREQAALGRELCKGLPIQFIVADYREYTPTKLFDHAVSIEMIEAVGPKNMSAYFKTVQNLLKPRGRFFLQTSGSMSMRPIASTWLNKYIFPNGVLPSLPKLERASGRYFEIAWSDEIGRHYERTLLEWWRRFERAYPMLSDQFPQYNERFYRMWKMYLQSSAAFFRVGEGRVWQGLLVSRQRSSEETEDVR